MIWDGCGVHPHPSQIIGNHSMLSSCQGKCGIGPCVGEEFPKSPLESALLAPDPVATGAPWQFSTLTKLLPASGALQSIFPCLKFFFLHVSKSHSLLTYPPYHVANTALFPAAFLLLYFSSQHLSNTQPCYVYVGALSASHAVM